MINPHIVHLPSDAQRRQVNFRRDRLPCAVENQRGAESGDFALTHRRCVSDELDCSILRPPLPFRFNRFARWRRRGRLTLIRYGTSDVILGVGWRRALGERDRYFQIGLAFRANAHGIAAVGKHQYARTKLAFTVHPGNEAVAARRAIHAGVRRSVVKMVDRHRNGRRAAGGLHVISSLSLRIH